LKALGFYHQAGHMRSWFISDFSCINRSACSGFQLRPCRLKHWFTLASTFFSAAPLPFLTRAERPAFGLQPSRR
jgi:hypothetical protein